MKKTVVFEKWGATILVAAAVLLGGIVAFVHAEVQFDPISGTGFVGKGDVQSAFKWNNAKLQENADKITFSYEGNETYTAVCTIRPFGDEDSTTIVPYDVSTTGSVSSDIQYDERTHKQITGFILKGFGDKLTQKGNLPVQGTACTAEYEGRTYNGTWTSVSISGTMPPTHNLYVIFEGNKVLLQ